MTLAELEQAIGERRVCRQAGVCFVMVYTTDEADAFAAKGARVNRDASTPRQFAAEAHLAGMLDFVGEPAPDDPERIVDIRDRVVLDHFRERDGYSWPARARP